ncbi:4-(cytidine 5'-diphospho)-2-C-methyl-D-erythritol kinase [Candidatus Pacearchaeota archaeon]|nr:MAG: 4-(cytidine 5'-diphospho)-2-C-methyl-D-erythritol kinase [Candidatus Pacearchaeota archaeon]
MKNISILTPAKINLTLQVLKRRPDNYHEIYTIFQKITLFDEIEITKGSPSFHLEFISSENIPLEKNLVFKAYQLFKNTFEIKDEVSIKVKKNIPIGAGLGGGSSNASGTLKGLAELFEINPKSLFNLARNLGADVLFFLSPYSSAIGEGIGDILTPYPSFPAWYVLIYPGFKVETKWAYESLNLKKPKKPLYYSQNIPPWYQPQGLINDFKNLIFERFPKLKKYENFLKDLGAIATGLSGTGSTIFGVFENKPDFFKLNRVKILEKDGKIFIVKNLS